MSSDPRIRHFGPLELVEVYEFFDKPVLASYRDTKGTLFLAVLIDETREGDETWLYVPLSEGRFQLLRTGAVDLHTAFKQPEEGVTYEVRIPGDRLVPAAVTPLSSAMLTDEMLPTPGEHIELPAPARRRSAL